MTSDLNKAHYVESDNVYITPRGRSSFVALSKKFKNKKNPKEGDEGKYGVELSFPPGTDLKLLRKAANEALKEKWPKADYNDKAKSRGFKDPFLRTEDKLADITSQGETVDLDGWVTIRTSAYSRKPVVRDSKGNVIDADELDVEAYSGRWMRLMVRPSAYENEGKGVTFYLEGVQLLKHDDKIGGGGAPANTEAFGAVDDDEDEDSDPLA